MTEQNDYILTGYLRFVESDKIGVMAEVISVYHDDYAVPSDIPIYRKLHKGGRAMTKKDLDGD